MLSSHIRIGCIMRVFIRLRLLGPFPYLPVIPGLWDSHPRRCWLSRKQVQQYESE